MANQLRARTKSFHGLCFAQFPERFLEIARLSGCFAPPRSAGEPRSLAHRSMQSYSACVAPHRCYFLSLSRRANELGCSMGDCRMCDGLLAQPGDIHGASYELGQMPRDGIRALYRPTSIDRSRLLLARPSMASIRRVTDGLPCPRICQRARACGEGVLMDVHDACGEVIT